MSEEVSDRAALIESGETAPLLVRAKKSKWTIQLIHVLLMIGILFACVQVYNSVHMRTLAEEQRNLARSQLSTNKDLLVSVRKTEFMMGHLMTLENNRADSEKHDQVFLNIEHNGNTTSDFLLYRMPLGQQLEVMFDDLVDNSYSVTFKNVEMDLPSTPEQLDLKSDDTIQIVKSV